MPLARRPLTVIDPLGLRNRSAGLRGRGGARRRGRRRVVSVVAHDEEMMKVCEEVSSACVCVREVSESGLVLLLWFSSDLISSLGWLKARLQVRRWPTVAPGCVPSLVRDETNGCALRL